MPQRRGAPGGKTHLLNWNRKLRRSRALESGIGTLISPVLPVHPLAGSLARALLSAGRAIAAVRAGRSLAAALPAERLTEDIRAQVQDLTYGALRRYGWGDFILDRLLDRPLPDATAQGILLAALHRLESRPDSAHVVVDQAVEAAGRLMRGQFRGVTNGVLRNYLRRRDQLLAEAATDDAATYWHPVWWLDALREAYPADWKQIAAAGNQMPPMTLRVNRRRSTPEAYLRELAEVGIEATLVGASAVRLTKPMPIDQLPGFAEGRVSVQDAGAQRAAELLDARPGQRVLDACAAPGGKTSHILELADVELLALDLDPERCRRVEENLVRLRLSTARVRVLAADARQPDTWSDGRRFDRILADVPCSATGVIRRHPDAKWLRRPDDIRTMTRTQDEILEALWPLLAAGGQMLYATCSVFPQENAKRVDAFIERHADASRQPVDGWPNLQLLPGENHDGFFYALLAKRP
jgi:16S rRNA (cytosine967-C5)-methyltransferase